MQQLKDNNYNRFDDKPNKNQVMRVFAEAVNDRLKEKFNIGDCKEVLNNHTSVHICVSLITLREQAVPKLAYIVILVVSTPILFKHRRDLSDLPNSREALCIVMQWLINLVSDGNIAGAAILSSLALMPSSPVALGNAIDNSISATLFWIICGI